MSVLFSDGGNDLLCLVQGRTGEVNKFQPIGKVIEEGEWNSIPIYKEAPQAGVHNPITVQDVVNSINYFGLSPNDLEGLMNIIISGRSPYSDELNSGWAFGAYQVIWEETSEINEKGRRIWTKRPKENRLVLWGQKIDKVRFNLGGEIREGYYYRVQPIYQGQAIDRYISVKALRREILGDTLIHEIGHHVDIWHYGRYIGNSKDRAKAEKFAETYAKSHAAKKRDMPEFETLIDGTYQPAGQAPQQQGAQEDQSSATPPTNQVPQASSPQQASPAPATPISPQQPLQQGG